MEKTKIDILKLMYDQLLKELDRVRDWPIKVMGFSTILYSGLISILLLKSSSLNLLCKDKTIITICLGIFYIWIISLLVKNHKLYLDYRKTQSQIQKAFEIDKMSLSEGDKIFPDKWTNSGSRNIFKGWLGWGFFVLYLTLLTFISLFLLFSKT